MPCDFVIYKLHEFQMHFVHCTELVIRTRLILRPLVKPSKVTFDADHPFAVGILSQSNAVLFLGRRSNP